MAHATLITEEPVFKTDSHERGVPRVSPDGKQLAYILDRNKLAVRDLASGKTRRLTDGSTYLHRDGKFTYAWSPDSRWIALEVVARKHDPYTDIALLNVADGTLTNLTNSGYFDASPVWVMDGNAIMFASERYGMRNHASWGSMMDVMLVFLNQDALDRWQLSKEDLALLKDAEKKAKKDAKKDDKADKDKKDKKGDKDSKDEADDKAIKVELAGIEDRLVRVTPQSVDLVDALLTDDGETLYYLTDTPDGNQLWKLEPREDEHKLVTTLSSSASFATPDGGKTAFLLGSAMKKLDTKSGKLTPITYSGTATVDHAAEREAMYDNMAREVAARFYVADMHGVDWPAMTAAYRRFLPHISNNYDYAELLSELLGELNASHTGGRYAGASSSQADRTASLGLLYDLGYKGDGLRIAEVVAGGPLATAASKAAPGVIIEKIDGTPLTPHTDLATLLTDKAGRRTLLSMRGTDGSQWDEVVKPVSTGRMSDLMYRRWVRSRAAAVDSLSHGRLGYVHLESMDDESFRRVLRSARQVQRPRGHRHRRALERWRTPPRGYRGALLGREVLHPGNPRRRELRHAIAPLEQALHHGHERSLLLQCPRHPLGLQPPRPGQARRYARAGHHDLGQLGAYAGSVAHLRHPRHRLPPARRLLPREPAARARHQGRQLTRDRRARRRHPARDRRRRAPPPARQQEEVAGKGRRGAILF